MAKCPYCGNELQRYDEKRYYCSQCNKYFNHNHSASTTQSAQQNDDFKSAELQTLKARIAALEAEKQQVPTKKTRINKSTLLASPALAWFKKYGKIILPVVLGLIIFITLMVCLVGIRGIYVNVDNPNVFYSFTATDYEYHGSSAMGDYVDKGTWKKSGNKLLLTYKDEDFGKITEENTILKNDGNKVLVLEDEFGMQNTFKRVNIINYSAVATKVNVTFNANGGKFKTGSNGYSYGNQTYETKIGNKLNMDLDVVRDGKDIRFMGWYTEPFGYKSATAQQYDKNYRVWESITYYANWYNPTEYTISFGESSVNIREGDFLLPKIKELNQQLPSAFTFEYYFNDKVIDENTVYIAKYQITRKLLSINSNITQIPDYAFKDCINESITIPNSVTSIGYSAFWGCSSLTSITIPDSVTSIGGDAFYNTAWYDNQPDGLVYAGKVAYEYKGIIPDNTSIVIKDGTKSIGDLAFYNCSSLTSITIPDSVTSIGDSAFYNCSSLTSITIPDSVTSIGYSAFQGCSSLTSITIPFVGKTKNGTDNNNFGYIFGTSSYVHNSNYVPRKLKKVIITGGMSIGDSAFYNCSSLTSITIPDSVTSIGIGAFQGCELLTSITIPDSVTSIGIGAFYNCSSLTSITIPDSVTSIGSWAFYYCSSLTTIYCEAENQPSSWDIDWKYYCDATVIWGYKGEL